MPIYQTTGTLTDTILEENVEAAQAFLTDDDMTQYIHPDALQEAVDKIEWKLHDDGHTYHITAVTNRTLGPTELGELGSWVSGQNSDGLGESFEQQDFAWYDEECGECGDNGWGCECGLGHMISFDWKTNQSTFIAVGLV